MAIKMTPEMFQAIRRQEKNSGVNYWNTNAGSTSPIDRRQSYNRLTQINLDFPGAFNPNVGCTLSNQRTKRKPGSAGHMLVLNRSRTSMMPNIKQTKTYENSAITPNKAMVTDLTCLQLADTLISSKQTPFPGFFNISLNKPSYAEYFSEEKNDFENESDVETDDHLGQLDSTHYKNSNTMCDNAKKYSFCGEETKNIEERMYQTSDKHNPVSPDFIASNISTDTHSIMKPKKSILKTGVCNPNNVTNVQTSIYSSPALGETAYTGTYQFDREKTRTHMTFTSIHPKIQALRSRTIVNDLPAQRHPKIDLTYSGVHNVLSRKRSVRFNAAHEIREYTPCEPVSYC